MTIYQTLKSVDPTATGRLVAETARAFGWDAGGIARWCELIGAPPEEVRQVIHDDRLAKDRANGVHGT